MKKLKGPIISVSGVRGEVGVSLDMQTITRFALAFGTLVSGGTVVLGIDSRTSSPMLRHAVLAGLIATGCQVMDVGLCPTPTVLLTAKVLNAQGSITITASHNPVEWNGIEFASASGQLLTQRERDELLDIYDTENFVLMPWDKLGAHQVYTESTTLHLEEILNSSWLNIALIRNAKLKVALDCGNGAGCVMSPTLLKELGCEVIEVNCIPDGNFNRPAEPNPDAITELVETVVNTGADIGFAHDGDADRVVIVTDKGVALNGEWTFACVTDFIISKTKGDIVATVSTSRMIDDIAIKHDVKLHRTKVGVGYVVEKMHEVNAVIGGEGTGGVIYPGINHTTDGITSIAAILQHLVESEITVSTLIEAMPKYEMCRKKMEIPSQAIASQLLDQYKDEITSTNSDTASLELTDGIKRVWDDRWVNIRKSGTEPVIRIFSEAPTASEAEMLCNQTVERLEMLMKQIKR